MPFLSHCRILGCEKCVFENCQVFEKLKPLNLSYCWIYMSNKYWTVKTVDILEKARAVICQTNSAYWKIGVTWRFSESVYNKTMINQLRDFPLPIICIFVSFVLSCSPIMHLVDSLRFNLVLRFLFLFIYPRYIE